MKIYAIRHGKTKCNEEEKYNGKLDEDINETGIKQAQEASKKVQSLDIDLIICSPLLRTRHTCEIVNINNVPVIYDERIKERDCGEYTGKPLGDFYHTDFWNLNSTKHVEGLESLEHLLKRAKDFLDDIKEKYEGKNILLVTHGGTARAIHYYFNELPEDGMIEKIDYDNCEIKEYQM